MGTYTKETQTKEIVCVVNVHIIHHERIVIVYDTMGTQIERASIRHIKSMFIHGEHMVHTRIGIMQWMGWIKIS